MLRTILHNHVLANDLGQLFGDLDTVLSDLTVRRPDILFVANDRFHQLGEQAAEAPIDLAVEIVSPSSVTTDRERKFAEYEAAGVLNYWLVDPGAETLDAFTLADGRFHDAGRASGDETASFPPFPGLPVPLGRFWRPLR